MSDNICISKNYFMIIIFIFSFFTYIHSIRMSKNRKIEKKKNYYLKLKNLEDSESETESDTIQISNKSIRNINNRLTNINMKQEEPKDIFIERDKKVINNILVAPERRLPRHAYPPKYLKDAINIPTRGYPDNYQQMGMLIRKNDEKILKLFGRQTYPGSSKYEYYVVDSNSNTDNKIPLKVNGDRELDDKQQIDVPWLDPSRGKFDVKIYDYNAPRYNPNLI